MKTGTFVVCFFVNLFLVFFPGASFADSDYEKTSTFLGIGILSNIPTIEDATNRRSIGENFTGFNFTDALQGEDRTAHDDSVFGLKFTAGVRKKKTGLDLECSYLYRTDWNPQWDEIEVETNVETTLCMLRAKRYFQLDRNWTMYLGTGVGASRNEIEVLGLKQTDPRFGVTRVDVKDSSTDLDLVWSLSLGVERHLWREIYGYAEVSKDDLGRLRFDSDDLTLRANRSSYSFSLGVKKYYDAPSYVETGSRWTKRFMDFWKRHGRLEIFGITRHDPNGSGGYTTKDGKEHEWNERNGGLGFIIPVYEPFDGFASFRAVGGYFRNSYRKDSWYLGSEVAINLPIGRLPLIPRCVRLSLGYRGVYLSGYDRTELRAKKYHPAAFQFIELGCDDLLSIRLTCLFDSCTNVDIYTLIVGPKNRA